MAETGTAAEPNRVLRGGSWNNNNPTNLLSSNRNNNTPTNRNDNNGFRCVLVVGSGGKAFSLGEFCPIAGWAHGLPGQRDPVQVLYGHLTRRPWPRDVAFRGNVLGKRRE